MKIILISLLMVTLSIKLSKIPSTNPPPSQRAYIVMDYDDSTNSIYISGGNKGSVAAYNEI